MSLSVFFQVSELKSVFDQYGDIVVSFPSDIDLEGYTCGYDFNYYTLCDFQNIDIRKGNSTHAICEFLDIASSVR